MNTPLDEDVEVAVAGIATLLHRLWCDDRTNHCSYGTTDIEVATEAVDKILELKG